jgi:hypothetical protein
MSVKRLFGPIAVLCLAANCLTVAADPSGEKFVTIAENVDVRTPGRVRWTPDLTLLSALSAAGGTGDFPRFVTIIRGTEKLTFSIKKVERNPETDPKLLPGDRIEKGTQIIEPRDPKRAHRYGRTW